MARGEQEMPYIPQLSLFSLPWTIEGGLKPLLLPHYGHLRLCTGPHAYLWELLMGISSTVLPSCQTVRKRES